MDNFIRLYDNVIDPNMCSHLIDKFETHSEMHMLQDNANGTTLTFINMLDSSDTPFSEDVNFLFKVLSENIERYKEDILKNENQQWPKKYGFEPPKFKRYLPDTTDEFPDHVDVTNFENCRRFLVMFIYLDDNEAGHTLMRTLGENISIPCRKGSILFFPPFWPWLHAGRKPVDKPKYIIGSYLHYVQ